MNEWDYTGAIHRFIRASKPNRLALALIVRNLATWADDHSDGWAHWPKPARAAQSAMRHIQSTTHAADELQEREDITDAELRAAVRPIKAFLTSQKVPADQRELILRAAEEG
jgi:hypothetical protein